MKIILKKDIEKVGRAGEIVDVKPGFARNYLIPSGNAVLATKGNLKVYEMEQKRAEQRLSQEKVVSQAWQINWPRSRSLPRSRSVKKTRSLVP
jgi:large subunit ribosomal protein L9